MEMWKTQKAAFPTFPQALLLATKQIKSQDRKPRTKSDRGGDFYVIEGGKIT